MTSLLLFACAVLTIAVLLLITRNATLLFSATIRNGRIVNVRGSAPKGLINDLNDVLHQKPSASGSLRVFVQNGLPALEAKGNIHPQEQQRLRNVLGTWPLAKIRH